MMPLAPIEQSYERTGIRDDRSHLPYPDMCLRFVARSIGPSTDPTRLPASEVTERLFPFARDSSASRSKAERLEPRERASSFRASSRSSGSLKETVRIGVVMVLPPRQKSMTRAAEGQPTLSRRAPKHRVPELPGSRRRTRGSAQARSPPPPKSSRTDRPANAASWEDRVPVPVPDSPPRFGLPPSGSRAPVQNGPRN